MRIRRLEATALSALPAGDHTPSDWAPENETARKELCKRVIRWMVYPLYLKAVNQILERRYDRNRALGVTQWYWGHRGSEYQFLRSLVNHHCRIRGSSVLVIGCGTGRDIASWMSYKPAQLIGIDLFNYERAWSVLETIHGSAISFAQADMRSLAGLPAEHFDIVGSDAVLEHVNDVPAALNQAYWVLKPGATLYASFGPLWHCFAGDHISGYDSDDNGYNHLLLDASSYIRYLAGAGEFKHSEDDGRTWIKNGLFSYLKIQDYLEAMVGAGFVLERVGLMIDPKGVKYLARESESRAKLRQRAGDLDLLAAGMYVIARKSATRA